MSRPSPPAAPLHSLGSHQTELQAHAGGDQRASHSEPLSRSVPSRCGVPPLLYCRPRRGRLCGTPRRITKTRPRTVQACGITHRPTPDPLRQAVLARSGVRGTFSQPRPSRPTAAVRLGTVCKTSLRRGGGVAPASEVSQCEIFVHGDRIARHTRQDFDPNGVRAPHYRRTHPRDPRTCRRAIHKLLSANSIVNRAVFLTKPR